MRATHLSPHTKRAGRGAGLAVPSLRPAMSGSLAAPPIPHPFSFRPLPSSRRRILILLGVPTTVLSNKKREPLGVRPQKLSRCSGRKTPNIRGTLEQHPRSVNRLRSSYMGNMREMFSVAAACLCASHQRSDKKRESRRGCSHRSSPPRLSLPRSARRHATIIPRRCQACTGITCTD